MTAGHPQESQALVGSGREPEEPFTQPCSSGFSLPGYSLSGLRWSSFDSAAPSIAPLALLASHAGPQFSAASGGAPLASAHSTLAAPVPRLV